MGDPPQRFFVVVKNLDQKRYWVKLPAASSITWPAPKRVASSKGRRRTRPHRDIDASTAG
jgi:hypothetical protein